MRVLGAVLAGGRSSRFGSDKAEAKLAGHTLLERAISSIRPYCEALTVIGRTHPDLVSLDDWPRPDMGPLGGFAAALIHARDMGFDAVLSMSVDGGALTDEMVAALNPAPAHLASQPVIGLWPVSALDPLQMILAGDGKHSVLRWCEMIASRGVTGFQPDNINTPDYLTTAEQKLRSANDDD